MGFRFPLRSFDPKLNLEICNLLTFEPKASFTANEYSKKDPPIEFWVKDDKNITVPYRLGKVLLENFKSEVPTYPEYNFKITGSLRETQIPVVNEALEILKVDGSVILALHTGFGKTFVASSIASQLGGKVMVVYTRLFLGTSWSNTFKSHSDCQNFHITEEKELDQAPDILLVPITRISWVPKKVRDQYRILIVDEAHEFCTPKNCKQLLQVTPEYVICLTATPNRRDGLFKMMETFAGKFIYRKSKRPFYVHKIETDAEPEIRSNRRGQTDWTFLVKSLSEDADRNALIVHLIENRDDKKVLFLTSRKAHLEAISGLLRKKKIAHSTFYGKAKTYNDSMIVLGTFKKMSTGFDEEMACPDFCGIRFNLLILGSSLKDHLVLEQSIGRVFRIEKPDIIDLVDSHPILEKHWQSRAKWYKTHKGKIKA